MTTVGIFGCSGFARETADIAHALGMTAVLIAYNKDDISHIPSQCGYMLESDLDAHPDLPLAIGIGDNQRRKQIAERFAGRQFINLIHPSVTVGFGQQALLEKQKGLILCAGVRLTNHITLGDFCIINLNATVGHDCLIEDFVNIAPGANISGNVALGEACWIGTNAAINQGSDEQKLRIGERTIIASGSVVLKPCDADAVYAGVPAVRKK